MEVLLNCGNVTTVGGGFVVAVIFIAAGIIIGISCFADDFYKTGTICFIIAALGIAAAIFIPECGTNMPTNVYKYVVEITDENKYKELVDNNYSLDRLYENRDIYEITGDVLE